MSTAVTTAITSKENMTTDHRPPKLPEQLPELMAKHPGKPDAHRYLAGSVP